MKYLKQISIPVLALAVSVLGVSVACSKKDDVQGAPSKVATKPTPSPTPDPGTLPDRDREAFDVDAAALSKSEMQAQEMGFRVVSDSTDAKLDEEFLRSGIERNWKDPEKRKMMMGALGNFEATCLKFAEKWEKFRMSGKNFHLSHDTILSLRKKAELARTWKERLQKASQVLHPEEVGFEAIVEPARIDELAKEQRKAEEKKLSPPRIRTEKDLKAKTGELKRLESKIAKSGIQFRKRSGKYELKSEVMQTALRKKKDKQKSSEILQGWKKSLKEGSDYYRSLIEEYGSFSYPFELVKSGKTIEMNEDNAKKLGIIKKIQAWKERKTALDDAQKEIEKISI